MTTIMLNGNPFEVAENTTAAMLVDLLSLGGKRLAMEYNEAVLPRSRFAETVLQSNDVIEIVHAIGGG